MVSPRDIMGTERATRSSATTMLFVNGDPAMFWTVIKCAVDQWFQHRSARLGAALAYYSVFSMGPLLLIVTSIAGLLFGADAVRGSLSAQFSSLLGETGSKAVETMLAGASSEQSGMLAG